MKLSVIVPVYNTVQYLKQCIDSIVRQTYKDMQIILVDDGSTDGSGEICDYYAECFENIQVFHQENGGIVAARKLGIFKATGEYIGFVDSDDWIAEDMYETLMKVVEAENSDIVSMGYTMCMGENQTVVDDATIFGSYYEEKNMGIIFSKMIFDFEKETRGITPALWTKVIKRSILVQEIMHIDLNITLGEDAALFYPCCLCANSICIIREYKYYYRISEGTMSHSYNIDSFNKIYILYIYLKQRLEKVDKKYNLENQLKKYLWFFLGTQIEKIFSLELKKVYLFPYKKIKKGSKIILYGAGKVGESYQEQIKKSGYCDIVAWADRASYKNKDYIISPKQIAGMDYSYIVVAIKSKECLDEIINDLVALGIDKGKIVWEEPQMMSMLDTKKY